MYPFQDTFYSLEYMGIFDVILPFLLIFTIVFAVLNKVNLFGSGDPDGRRKTKPFNVVIAMVMGLGVVYPHVASLYPPDRDIVTIINTSLPNVSVVVVAIVMALIIIGVFGKRFEIGEGSLSGWIALAAFGVIIYIFGGSAGWWETMGSSSGGGLSPDVTALIVTVLVFAIIIWFITKEDRDPNSKRLYERVGEDFSKMLKGP